MAKMNIHVTWACLVSDLKMILKWYKFSSRSLTKAYKPFLVLQCNFWCDLLILLCRKKLPDFAERQPFNFTVECHFHQFHTSVSCVSVFSANLWGFVVAFCLLCSGIFWTGFQRIQSHGGMPMCCDEYSI